MTHDLKFQNISYFYSCLNVFAFLIFINTFIRTYVYMYLELMQTNWKTGKMVNCLTYGFHGFHCFSCEHDLRFHDMKCLSEWLHKTIDVISFSKYLPSLSLKCSIITFKKLFNVWYVACLCLFILCDAFWKVSWFLSYIDHKRWANDPSMM